jgi:hypothetical protein
MSQNKTPASTNTIRGDPAQLGRNARTLRRRARRSRRRSAAGTAAPARAGKRPGRRPGRAAAARPAGRSPARPPDAGLRARGRRGSGSRAGRAALCPPSRRALPPAERTGKPPQVSGACQVAPARADTLGKVILGPVRDLPGHRRARTARLLPLLLLPGGPPFPARRPPSRLVIRAGRNRGIPAVPRQRPQRPLQLLPQVSDHRFQHGDLLRLLADQRITRILRQRRTGHSRQSSSRPQTAATPAPGPPPKRSQQSSGATQRRVRMLTAVGNCAGA